VLKEQVSAFFEVTPRTIDNYIEKFGEELRQNGYEVLRGNRLKSLKLEISRQGVNETDFVTKTTALGIFGFRAFLNIGMLIGESERARLLRQMILDIVIDTINQRSGGGTKYINQRDEDFLLSWFQEENYRKEFTDALKNYVDMGNFKTVTAKRISLGSYQLRAEIVELFYIYLCGATREIPWRHLVPQIRFANCWT